MKELSAARPFAYLLILAGYLSLSLTPFVSGPGLGLACGLLWVSYRGRVAPRSGPMPFRRPLGIGLAAAGGLEIVLNLAQLNGHAAWTGGLFWLALAWSFTSETVERYYVSFGLVVIQMVVAGGATDHIVYALAILIFIFAGSLGMAALTLFGGDSGATALFADPTSRGGSSTVPPCPVYAGPPVASPYVVRLAALVTSVIIAATVFLFFVIPRYGAGYFFTSNREQERRVAFSDRVSFGALGKLQQGGGVALRVDLLNHQGPFPGVLRWRGVALDHFDGRTWVASPGPTVVMANFPRGAREQRHFVGASHSPNPRWVRQRIFMAQENAVLFGLSRVQSVWGKFSRLERNAEDSLLVQFPAFVSKHYTCSSVLADHPVSRLRGVTTTWPEHTRRRYLQLPERLSPRVAELARTIVRGARDDYERVTLVERHLSNTYEYSLSLDATQSSDAPIENFLFGTRRGHCEYFSASMVVLLRTLGIPSRVVNGYLQGSYNALGGYYVVSDEDAHSWVEVLFPKVGFLEFDPTPAGALASRRGHSWLRAVALGWDAVIMAWRRHVIDYHLLDQMEQARALLQFLSIVKPQDPGVEGALARTGDRTLPPLIVFVIAVGVVLVSLLVTLRRRATVAADTVELGPASFYLELLSRLERLGVARRPSRTGAELVVEVARRWPGLALPVEQLTRLYYRIRFGGSLAGPEDGQRIRQWLARIRPGRQASVEPDRPDERPR
ncbi:MAG: DUF3488 domain-containing protein [Candidatus Riflebacteria bacterium]|nr:DUF3488 domain-containing protein [Candidatus Riflebacteria bacterium]